MITVNAHFDGKVIVLDEPVGLRLNQPLRLSIEEVGTPQTGQESALEWLAANAIEDDRLPPDLAERHDHYLYGTSSLNQQDQ